MSTRSCRVGLHGRNNITFAEVDYQAIRAANIETLKMMGQTSPAVFQRIKTENPDIEFITRLYDDRFGVDKHPTPEEFVARQVPIMSALQPYCTKFEVHNEPNHQMRYEGWGQEDRHAEAFNNWFLQVYALIKQALPWTQLGFPGLAIPHRDLEWIKICRPAIERADWLGVHCYWQTPPGQERNHLNDAWGLRFKYYHQEFPQKIIDITECGNSNIQANPPIEISEAALAQQFVEYYQELFRYPYLNSASFFLLSSQDPTWDFFAWRSENGRVKPVVSAVGKMPRPTRIPARAVSGITTPGTETTIGGEFSLPTLSIKNIAASLPRSTTAQYPNRALTAINQIVIHHTAISEKVGPQRVAEAQVSRLKKPGITYHYFIAEDGTVYQTNALTTETDHTAGYNARSIAIAFAGNFTSVTPSAAQIRAGSILCATLMLKFNIPPANIVGAQELIATQSPGKQWLAGARWKDTLMAKIYQLRTSPDTAPTEPGVPASDDDLRRLAQQLADALTANQLAQQKIAVLEAELARLRNSQPPTQPSPGDSQTIADLKARIAELELQLSVARDMAGNNGAPAPITSPTPPKPQIVPPKIENIVAQLPHHSTLKYPTRTRSDIRMIVVHHSGVPASITAQKIADFRVNQSQWAGIGFHFFVLPDGTIQQTNKLTTISRHAGDQDEESVGVTFAGNFTTDTPTAQQIVQGGHLIAWLVRSLNLSAGDVVGHKAIASTPCPGTDWESSTGWGASLRQTVARWLSGAVPTGAPSVTESQPAGQPVQPPAAKTIFHYLLLGSAADQQAATNYISAFNPTVGFDSGEAAKAQFVTIVGNTAAVSASVEQRLRATGSQVERVAGNSPIAVQALLDNMARTNRRFLTLEGA